jgi:hypothetical protein
MAMRQWNLGEKLSSGIIALPGATFSQTPGYQSAAPDQFC